MAANLKLNVNLLCIAGACIGVAAMSFTWIYYPPSMLSPPDPRMTPSVVFMVSHQAIAFGAALLFLIGTLAAFASPLGGFLQISSLVLFGWDVVESGNGPWLDGIDPQHQLRLGMYLGILSAAIVMASLLCPIGPGRMRVIPRNKPTLVERILTVSRTRNR